MWKSFWFLAEQHYLPLFCSSIRPILITPDSVTQQSSVSLRTQLVKAQGDNVGANKYIPPKMSNLNHI